MTKKVDAKILRWLTIIVLSVGLIGGAGKFIYEIKLDIELVKKRMDFIETVWKNDIKTIKDYIENK